MLPHSTPARVWQISFFVRGLRDSFDWSSVRSNNAAHLKMRVIIVILGQKSREISFRRRTQKLALVSSIWTKNYAEKEKKKENVGIDSSNLTFFGDPEIHQHELNLHIFPKRYGAGAGAGPRAFEKYG